jgi:hypothetical protein
VDDDGQGCATSDMCVTHLRYAEDMAIARERRSYSAEEKASILAVLEANGGNFFKTAALCRVPRTTLKRWVGPQPRTEAECQQSGGGVAELRQRKREELATSLRALASQLVGVVERELPRMSGRDASIALGIVCDKLTALEAAAKQDEAEHDPAQEAKLALFRKHFAQSQEMLRARYGADAQCPNQNPRSLTLTSSDIREARQILDGAHDDQQTVGQQEQVEPEVVESRPEGAPLTVLKPATPKSPPPPWRKLFN